MEGQELWAIWTDCAKETLLSKYEHSKTIQKQHIGIPQLFPTGLIKHHVKEKSCRAPIVFHGLKRKLARILVASRVWNQGKFLLVFNRIGHLNYFRDCTSGVGASKYNIYESYLKDYMDLKSYELKKTG